MFYSSQIERATRHKNVLKHNYNRMNKKIKSSRSFNETSTNVRVSDDSAADCCQWSAAAIVCIIKGSTHRKLEAISANTLFLLDTGGSYNGRHFSSSEDPDDEAANPPVKVHSVL